MFEYDVNQQSLSYQTPACTIDPQPESGTRFRYACEVIKNTHGVILAKNTLPCERIYPTVYNEFKTSTPENLKLFMKPLLYVKNTDGYFEPTAHCLTGNALENKCNNDELTESPIEMLKEGNKWKYVFKNFILKIERKDKNGKEITRTILRKKYENLFKWSMLQFNDVNNIGNEIERRIDNYMKRKDSLRVYINFVTYQSDCNGNFTRILETFSEPIEHVHIKGLEIEKICDFRIHRNASPNETVTLVLNTKVNKNECKLTVHHIDNKVRVYEKIIPQNDINMLGQNHVIQFKPPKLPEQLEHGDDVDFYVTLERLKDNHITKAQRFIYTNQHGPPSVKRKLATNNIEDVNQQALIIESDCRNEETVTINKKTPNTFEEFMFKIFQPALENIIDLLLTFSNDYGIDHCGDTILHAIVKKNSLKKLYPRLHELKIEKDCWQWRNDYGETVLHTAIKLKKPDYIRALIRFECSLNAQDNNSATALHLAIQMGDVETIEVFRNLLQIPLEYSHLTNELRMMFTIFNSEGYTALHLAVLHNLKDLVMDMLKFCAEQNIEACSIGTLGCGDTILHLAVDKNLTELAKSILLYNENAHFVPNLGGRTVYDIINDSDFICSEDLYSIMNK